MFLHAVFYWNGTRSWNPCLLEAKDLHIAQINAMTADELYKKKSSNGNIFHVTGHLCGEFTGPRWIPSTKASDAEFWCFRWSASE